MQVELEEAAWTLGASPWKTFTDVRACVRACVCVCVRACVCVCDCETVAIFLWPANRPFVNCLLPRRSARSAFACWLGRCPAARLSPRLAFRNSPSGAIGAGAGAAAAAAAGEAEAAWCCGTGDGAGGTSYCSEQAATRKGLISPTLHNLAGSKKYIHIYRRPQ